MAKYFTLHKNILYTSDDSQGLTQLQISSQDSQ